MPIVYTLTCKDRNKNYIGSSMTTKEDRFSKHLCAWKRWKNGKGHWCASFELFEIGDVEIHIILECPNDISNLELRQIEQIYIDNCECVNIKKSFISDYQLKEYNKEYMKEYVKTDEFKKQKKEYNKKYYQSKKLKTI